MKTLALLVALVLAGCAPPRLGLSFRQLDYPAPTRTVAVDGVDISYVELGRGEPTLLLLHGLNSYIPAWSRNLDDLAARHHVVAIDLPGYGRSSKANYRYSMAFFARAVEGVIEALRLGRVVLVGHSMGGQVALTHALAYPGRAEALVLAAPAGFETFSPGERAALIETLSKQAIALTPPERIYAGFASTFAGDVPADAMFMVRDRIAIIGGPDFDGFCYAVARSVAAMAYGPVFERLPAIAVPVLAVFGSDDRLIPNPLIHGGSTRAVAERAVARLPRGRLVMLPRVGHFVQWEAAAAFDRLLLDFVDGLDAPPARQAAR